MTGKVVGLGFEIIFKLDSYFSMTVIKVFCQLCKFHNRFCITALVYARLLHGNPNCCEYLASFVMIRDHLWELAFLCKFQQMIMGVFS